MQPGLFSMGFLQRKTSETTGAQLDEAKAAREAQDKADAEKLKKEAAAHAAVLTSGTLLQKTEKKMLSNSADAIRKRLERSRSKPASKKTQRHKAAVDTEASVTRGATPADLEKETHLSSRPDHNLRGLVTHGDVSLHEPQLSHHTCTGLCCTPLARNRSCVWRNLLFRPPGIFYYLTNAPEQRREDGVYLHNRFSSGEHLRGTFSHWSPTRGKPFMALGVHRVVEMPMYLAADLHANAGHNMLDSIFPFVPAVLRLRAVLKKALSSTAVAAMLDALPDLENEGDPTAARKFIFFLFDPPFCCPGYHRGSRERLFAEAVAGHVVDLPQLLEACPGRGCMVRTVIAGAGHQGLCMVDHRNFIGGSQEHRSLWQFRGRVYRSFGVPPSSLVLHGGVPPIDRPRPRRVVIVETKRMVLNLAMLAAALQKPEQRSNEPVMPLEVTEISAQVIQWERLSFVQQLKLIATIDVQVSGVGTAQMNSYLLPPGSVAVCLGWRHEESSRRIHYFDSHLLRSLDHVRVLYYPNYSTAELSGGLNTVTLDMEKAVRLVRSAVALQKAGVRIPVAEDDNANDYDSAFEMLVERTGGLALQLRTGDGALPPPDKPNCMMNGVADMIYGEASRACPWANFVPLVRARFGL